MCGRDDFYGSKGGAVADDRCIMRSESWTEKGWGKGSRKRQYIMYYIINNVFVGDFPPKGPPPPPPPFPTYAGIFFRCIAAAFLPVCFTDR